MKREEWSPIIGTIDILRYLRARAHWGALIWACTVGLASLFETGGGRFAGVGGMGVGIVMTWRMYERHQWSGFVPYLIATVGILLVVVPLTLLAHWILEFPSTAGLPRFLAFAALGALLHGGESSIRPRQRPRD